MSRSFSIKTSASLYRQRGAATLFVTVIVVLLIALVTITMTRTTVLENRMTDSDLTSKQAFHAAQAGLDFALQQIIENELDVLNASCGTILVDETNPEDSPTFQLSFGSVDPVCPSDVLGLQTKSVIRSVGRSSDGASIRVLEVGIDLEREWLGAGVPVEGTAPPPPPVPSAIVAKGSVNLAGTTNAAPCPTLDACQALDRPGNPKPDISDVYDTLVTSGAAITGGDTGVPDAQILDQHKDGGRDDLSAMTGDQFFESIMGVDKTIFKEAATVVTPGQTMPDVNVNPLVWYDGDLKLQTGTLGSPEKPITLVVNGDISVSGNLTVWGVVYTTGDDFSAGTTKIFGALIAENNITTSAGNASVFFNAELATVPPISGITGEVATVPGAVLASFDSNSWRELFLGP
jgi:Tfp pilus assembly protein PilX